MSCYVGSDGTSLILSRSDEQSPMAITSFQLVSSFTLADLSEDEDFRPDSEAVPNCARSSILSRAIATGGGLKLGMTRSQVERALAHGLQCVSRSKCSVELEDKERGVPHSGTNVHPYARITVGLKQGRVTSIRIIYSSMI